MSATNKISKLKPVPEIPAPLFTVFIQLPDLGSEFNQAGKAAKVQMVMQVPLKSPSSTAGPILPEVTD